YPREVGLPDMVREQASRTPSAIAVTDGAKSWTYRDLMAATDRFAGCLRAAGAGPGTLVGVCLDRSAEMVAALLGALEAGAAYVPLDPAYPSDRLAYLLEDSKVLLVLTTRELAGRLPALTGARVLCLEDVEAAPALAVAPRRVTPEDPAY